jgi:hypothetical protein
MTEYGYDDRGTWTNQLFLTISLSWMPVLLPLLSQVKQLYTLLKRTGWICLAIATH